MKGTLSFLILLFYFSNQHLCQNKNNLLNEVCGIYTDVYVSESGDVYGTGELIIDRTNNSFSGEFKQSYGTEGNFYPAEKLQHIKFIEKDSTLEIITLWVNMSERRQRGIWIQGKYDGENITCKIYGSDKNKDVRLECILKKINTNPDLSTVESFGWAYIDFINTGAPFFYYKKFLNTAEEEYLYSKNIVKLKEEDLKGRKERYIDELKNFEPFWSERYLNEYKIPEKFSLRPYTFLSVEIGEKYLPNAYTDIQIKAKDKNGKEHNFLIKVLLKMDKSWKIGLPGFQQFLLEM